MYTRISLCFGACIPLSTNMLFSRPYATSGSPPVCMCAIYTSIHIHTHMYITLSQHTNTIINKHAILKALREIRQPFCDLNCFASVRANKNKQKIGLHFQYLQYALPLQITGV